MDMLGARDENPEEERGLGMEMLGAPEDSPDAERGLGMDMLGAREDSPDVERGLGMEMLGAREESPEEERGLGVERLGAREDSPEEERGLNCGPGAGAVLTPGVEMLRGCGEVCCIERGLGMELSGCRDDTPEEDRGLTCRLGLGAVRTPGADVLRGCGRLCGVVERTLGAVRRLPSWRMGVRWNWPLPGGAGATDSISRTAILVLGEAGLSMVPVAGEPPVRRLGPEPGVPVPRRPGVLPGVLPNRWDSGTRDAVRVVGAFPSRPAGRRYICSVRFRRTGRGPAACWAPNEAVRTRFFISDARQRCCGPECPQACLRGPWA